ncbi:hypothetical protein GCG54_00011514 [Colletotrichum gloeosporioides]|uniref:Uncharacterized protein n=1 Tax=Colletotrichum gloeosporioides TaxID=474922 RepID=A0A8H4FPA5_COLGL|nr:uncharacterized protein GCG54_00011514 [Colletotrichum gloeosporioides]KAF3809316.1 hypothetical protein GCG54_00011514 [Colletotrichum gloeosporioides]
MHIQTPQHGASAGQPVQESIYNAFDSNMKKIDRQAISQESKINKRYDAKRARAESKYKNPGVFDICILTRNLTSKLEKIEQARERALQKHRYKIQMKRLAQEETLSNLAQSWLYRL